MTPLYSSLAGVAVAQLALSLDQDRQKIGPIILLGGAAGTALVWFTSGSKSAAAYAAGYVVSVGIRI